MKPARLILLAALGATLALGACKKDEDQPKAAAGGELLPRSVSDDMLPYDTVRSQASLAEPEAAGGAADTGARPAADASESAGDEADAAPAAAPPAEAPAVTPAEE